MKVLITGANGLIGSALVEHFSSTNLHDVVGMVRPGVKCFSEAQVEYRFCDLSAVNETSIYLNDIDIIIHTAARVHQMNDLSKDNSLKYMQINFLGTISLAKKAAKAGVKRFIFLSSIKVNGERSWPEKPFKYDDPRIGEDPYAKSKSEAELGLLKISAETKMEVTIIRPPLVYGPGVKANFLALLNLASKNIPLPLGSVNNRRSFVAVDNLINLISICIDHPKASNQVFLVSDDHDMSTSNLYKIMAQSIGKKAYVFKFNPFLLKILFKLIGKESIFERLCGDLAIDIEHTKNSLDWTPILSPIDGIKLCMQDSTNKQKDRV